MEIIYGDFQTFQSQFLFDCGGFDVFLEIFDTPQPYSNRGEIFGCGGFVRIAKMAVED